MPKPKRILTWSAILVQGFAVWFVLSRSELWVYMIRERKLVLFLGVYLLYLLGDRVMHGLVTSEIVRKSQLEADQKAAEKIQRSLQPDRLDPLDGYEIEAFYEPFRVVGGDYFDVIDLPDNRTLFAVADVSGKGIPAALLAANIQGLVRTLANVAPDPIRMADLINRHLCRYTPAERFATGIFVVLNRFSGELTYVNAGHNAPLVSTGGKVTCLDATGLPFGLLTGTEYQSGVSLLGDGETMLLFTDGLSDSIPDEDSVRRIGEAIAGDAAKSLSNLKSLIDPSLKEDDVTILLVRRKTHATSE